MFKLIQEIKETIQIVKMLIDRIENLERAYQKLWDETHPKTFGGN
jgi:hypothetical protein